VYFSKTLFITAIAALAPIAMLAGPVTSSPSLSIDGLSFSNFTCSISKGGLFATPSHCNQIDVNTITSPGTGIEFTSGFLAAPFSFDDAALTYNVTSASGISSVGLDFDGSFFGLAITSVTESVYSGSTLVGQAEVSCGAHALGAGCNLTDNIALNGVYNDLHIEKDINTTGIFGTAESSIIDQTFSQVPEPASTALLGLGLLAAAFVLRRHSQANSLK
jgi:hypothetical protein